MERRPVCEGEVDLLAKKVVLSSLFGATALAIIGQSESPGAALGVQSAVTLAGHSLTVRAAKRICIGKRKGWSVCQGVTCIYVW